MKKFQEIEEAIQNLNKEIEETKKQFTEKGSKIFHKYCEEIFENFPEVKSFGWSQYTPYFNDGDECVFGVNEVDRINGYSDYSDYADGEEDEEGENKQVNIYKNYDWDEKKSDPRSFEIVKTIRNFIDSIPKDILKEIYGDHCKVTIYRDGNFDVDEYEHD